MIPLAKSLFLTAEDEKQTKRRTPEQARSWRKTQTVSEGLLWSALRASHDFAISKELRWCCMPCVGAPVALHVVVLEHQSRCMSLYWSTSLCCMPLCWSTSRAACRCVGAPVALHAVVLEHQFALHAVVLEHQSRCMPCVGKPVALHAVCWKTSRAACRCVGKPVALHAVVLEHQSRCMPPSPEIRCANF